MTEIFKVRFEPMGLAVVVSGTDSTLMDVAAIYSLPMRFDCGGKGVCGKCRVIPEPPESLGPLTDTERRLLSPEQLEEGQRLACQSVVQGDVRVTVPEQLMDSTEVRGKDAVVGRYVVKPLVSRILLPKTPPPEPVDGRSATLADWLAGRAAAATGRKVLLEDRHALRQASLPEQCTGENTLVVHERRGVTAVLTGRHPTSLGLAFDLGTTTLAAYLCAMNEGSVLASASAVNPQRRFGEDVISRIAHANASEAGLRQMQNMLAASMNELIERCVAAAGVEASDVDEVTAVGNTTMLQVFAGLHPSSLGVTPYLPTAHEFPDLSAADLGLALNPGTNVYLLPVVSGFVGGDTMGATLADSPHRRAGTTLIVDIGTNGELMLSTPSGLWATSCATGPALEGAQISCGMRAVSGAIYKVAPGADGGVGCEVLGENGTRPLGLCGSGVIDAVATLRRLSAIETSGRFNPDAPGVVCDERGLGRSFVLVPAKDSGSGTDIFLSLKDVRSLQLAKAALSVGIEFLMRQAGVEQVDRTVLTGAFGARFDWKNAARIGMLPQGSFNGEVQPMDNLAGVGAIMALVNRDRRAEVARISREVRFIELAGDPAFAMQFARETSFPVLDASYDFLGRTPNVPQGQG
jgi:uncharacterized 2Fe-2S/4Fe-4S cluster protein (DUF4445 family)